MTKTSPFRRMALAGLVLCLATPALARDAAEGMWLREDGVARVKVAHCGSALCGTIVWLKDAKGRGKLGQRVFFDMQPNGADSWSGSAFNPEDGNTYDGKMTVSGDALTTTGCALAGLVCKSLRWSRFE